MSALLEFRSANPIRGPELNIVCSHKSVQYVICPFLSWSKTGVLLQHKQFRA